MKLRFRIWHLLVVTALIAVVLWAWPQFGFFVGHAPNHGSSVTIIWNGRVVLDYHLPPGHSPPATQSANRNRN